MVDQQKFDFYYNLWCISKEIINYSILIRKLKPHNHEDSWEFLYPKVPL